MTFRRFVFSCYCRLECFHCPFGCVSRKIRPWLRLVISYWRAYSNRNRIQIRRTTSRNKWRKIIPDLIKSDYDASEDPPLGLVADPVIPLGEGNGAESIAKLCGEHWRICPPGSATLSLRSTFVVFKLTADLIDFNFYFLYKSWLFLWLDWQFKCRLIALLPLRSIKSYYASSVYIYFKWIFFRLTVDAASLRTCPLDFWPSVTPLINVKPFASSFASCLASEKQRL